MFLAWLGAGAGEGVWARFRCFDRIANDTLRGSAKKCGLRRKV